MKRLTLVLSAVLAAALVLGAMSANATKPFGSADGPGSATELAKKGKKKGKKGKKQRCKKKGTKGKKGKKRCGKGGKKPSKPGKSDGHRVDAELGGGGSIEMTVSVENDVPKNVKSIKVADLRYQCRGERPATISFRIPGVHGLERSTADSTAYSLRESFSLGNGVQVDLDLTVRDNGSSISGTVKYEARGSKPCISPRTPFR